MDEDCAGGQEDHDRNEEHGHNARQQDGEQPFSDERAAALDFIASFERGDGDVHAPTGTPDGEKQPQAQDRGTRMVEDGADIVPEGGSGLLWQGTLERLGNLDLGAVLGGRGQIGQ